MGERLRHQREGDVEVDDEDAEDEDGEGKGGGDAGEDGERDGGDEEQGHDAGIERIEERHLVDCVGFCVDQMWAVVDGVMTWLSFVVWCANVLMKSVLIVAGEVNAQMSYRKKMK